MKNSHIWQSWGASVRGRRHAAMNEASQDAWQTFHGAWGNLAVVCDGLGSMANSGSGARMACVAAGLAARLLAGNSSVSPEDFTSLLHFHWLRLIGRESVDHSGCTCLFALTRHDELWLGQLGDGMIATVGGQPFTFDHEYEFLNITDCLEERHYPDLWHLKTVPAAMVQAVILSTDGVSADIALESRFEAASEFFNEFSGYPSTLRSRKTEEALLNWPFPDNSDDKTLVCLGRLPLWP